MEAAWNPHLTRWKLAAKSLWPGKIERRPREGFGVGGTTAIASTAQQCGKTCETPLRAGLDIESNMDLQGQVSYKWTILNHLTISNHFWETKRVWVSVSICLNALAEVAMALQKEQLVDQWPISHGSKSLRRLLWRERLILLGPPVCSLCSSKHSKLTERDGKSTMDFQRFCRALLFGCLQLRDLFFAAFWTKNLAGPCSSEGCQLECAGFWIWKHVIYICVCIYLFIYLHTHRNYTLLYHIIFYYVTLYHVILHYIV